MIKKEQTDFIFLAPTPKKVVWDSSSFTLPKSEKRGRISYSARNSYLQKQLAKLSYTIGNAGLLSIRCAAGSVKVPCNADQAYVLTVDSKGISLAANSEIGLLYALETLKQLKTGRRTYRCASIQDWPDMELRICARPLLCAESCRSALSWGDGRQAEMKRWRHEIDFALRCRYNGIFVHGFSWNTNPYPGFARSMRALNRYARERGVSLIFGGYGIGKGGWGQESYIGEAHNFLPGAGHEFHQDYPCSWNNPADEKTAYNGTCRSNPELRRLKVADIARFLKAVEPGALYIHHEDQCDFEAESQPFFWDKRCPACRAKWPNDALEAVDGGAGALADSYDVYGEACAMVKNAGYDASRDCRLLLCSPCYGSWYNPDAEWQKVEELWFNIARSMKYPHNVFIGMREQFAAYGSIGRLEHLARRIQKAGCPQKMFQFFVSGAALYGENAAFSSLPAMNSLVAGGNGAFFNFSGVLFQRPQQLYNCECTWNIYPRPGGETVEVTDRESLRLEYARRLAERQFMDERHCDANGYLARACRWIYGEKAGDFVFRYQLLHTAHGDGPLVVLYQQTVMERLFAKLTTPPDAQANPSNLRRPVISYEDAAQRWEEQAVITRTGAQLLGKARKFVQGWLGTELDRQMAQLQIGVSFAGLIAKLYRRAAGAAVSQSVLMQQLKKIERLMMQLPHSYPGKEDGDGAVYAAHIERLKNIITQTKQPRNKNA